MNTKSSQCSSPKEGSGKKLFAGVAFPVAIAGIYEYAVPEQFIDSIAPGMPVLVPLRSRETWGVVTSLTSSSTRVDLKEVLNVRTEGWNKGDTTLLKLYEWVAGYYQCDIGRVFKPLMRKGVMGRGPKIVSVYAMEQGADKNSLREKYRNILDALEPLHTFTLAKAAEKAGITPTSIKYLLKKGFLRESKETVLREVHLPERTCLSGCCTLTDEQRSAVEHICSGENDACKPTLLFGITGSGKTHVYIEIAHRMIERGRGVIILVPEIALTPQTIQRFREALGNVLTVIHSNMSDGERRDSLQELLSGKKRVVIGVRSAVLAPVDNLGCIIVDEEHDGSYKQSDREPRYHARDVAVMRARLQNALVVLGSATPSFESFRNARSGKYRLIKLSRRFGAAALPGVAIVDMREEQRANNWKPLSRRLINDISTTIENGRQVLLLLNRRGFSTVLLCQECGYVAQCPDCSVTMRYHKADISLKCHMCGMVQPAPDQCPVCRGEKIKYKGTGIQKIEEHLRETFPMARILRMDQDSTRKKGAHAAILGAFAERKADILLGTQMVAKGLNFPGVALVGVITADTGLHIPDFRASERTFQLLAQVAGRAGRTDNSGTVIIQTYCPDEFAITCAVSHDYETFFDHEDNDRKELGYPPYCRLVRIIVEGSDDDLVKKQCERIAGQIHYLAGATISLLGPAPAVIGRVKNESRYTILLKPKANSRCGKVLSDIRKMNRKIPSSVKIIIDVDPVNML